MKKLNLLFLLLTCGSTYAQTFITQIKTFETGKWGYMNSKGEMIIQPQYSRCDEFTEEGFAGIEENGFWFIDTKNQVLKTEVEIEFRDAPFFTDVHGFSEGLAQVIVKDAGRWGYIDTKGKLVIPAIYKFTTDFHGGFAIAQKAGNNYYVLDKTGKETHIPIERIEHFKSFSEGLAEFKTKDGFYGFIDPTGKIAIQPEYTEVSKFRGGLAAVRLKGGRNWGYINHKGELVIPAKYDVAKNFDPVSGIARTRTNNGWAYINQKGEETKISDTETFDDFRDGLCKGRKGEKFGFYDNTGKWVIEPKFDGARDFKNGYAAVKENGKWGMIDRAGNWVIKPLYAGIRDMELVK
ncbi:WG repeat-containing protein [Sporocytophaga myxococcoides]|uniref:WG repeat-containing protein n=1 Tax=Sporocytophaga myxococcoides TaxID=153721 RepID=UPI00049077EB|nr:WG repeat-containing protein [Sporocytophaga myxococcoides]